MLSDGDAFVALAAPGAAPGARMGGTGEGRAGFQHLLAAATLREVLLLDLRRPDQALLKWAHGAPLPCLCGSALWTCAQWFWR
jgi:hypothetical protein